MLTAIYMFMSSVPGIIIHSSLTAVLLCTVAYYAVSNSALQMTVSRQETKLMSKELELSKQKAVIKESQIISAALRDRLRAAEEQSQANKVALQSQIAKLKTVKPSNDSESVRLYLLDGRDD